MHHAQNGPKTEHKTCTKHKLNVPQNTNVEYHLRKVNDNLKMNPALLHKQLKDNASDLQDFCKDLKSWGEEMKRKEESLREPESRKTASTSKIRKIVKTEKKSSENSTKLKKPTTKVGATDYAAWDKFDADAECQKLEEDVNEDSELTDECNDKMQDEALVEKEKGNKFVKNQQWDEAIKCYSKAIEYYSYDPIFYANRALCYLKKSSFEKAEEDCNLSLKLDSTYVKAYQRRAAAREGLNKLEHAEYDLLKVLELEPKNKESTTSLVALRKKLGRIPKPPDQRPVSKFTASRNKSNLSNVPTTAPLISPPNTEVQNTIVQKNIDTSNPVPVWAEDEDIILVKPIKKPPHLRSQKPLKRIKIVEKDQGVTEIQTKELGGDKTEEAAIKKHVFEKKEVEKIMEESPKIMSAFKKSQLEKALQKSEHSTAWPRPDQQTVCLKSDDFKVIEKNTPEVPIKPVNISKEVKNTSNINISSNESKKYVNDDKSNAFVKPKTSVQFYLTWKNLRSTEEKYKYLKLIDPQDFPKIFLDSLESSVFSSLLEVLVKHFIENKDCVSNILDCFTRVKRFGTFTMFMTSSDKNYLWKLFDYIKENEDKSKEDVDRLIQKYEL